MSELPAGDPVALRAEHDRLAASLETRASVDLVKRGGVLTFFSVICVGMTAKLAWDRWGWIPPRRQPPPPGLPMYFLIALAITLVLGWLAVRDLWRSRAVRREEVARFARLVELRRVLGIDT